MSDFELTDHIATKSEINQECDRSQRVEVLTAASQLVEADSEKIFMLNTAGGFTVTLPSAADAGAGWSCKFVVKTAPTGNYVITEYAADDTDVIIVNGVNELEVDTSDDGVTNTGCTNVNFIANVAIAGDWFEIFCDATNFYVTGQTAVDGGVTAT